MSRIERVRRDAKQYELARHTASCTGIQDSAMKESQQVNQEGERERAMQGVDFGLCLHTSWCITEDCRERQYEACPDTRRWVVLKPQRASEGPGYSARDGEP